MKRIFAKDYIGHKFGRLFITSVEKDADGLNYAICTCECGSKFKARCSHIVSLKTRSCGCLKRETSKIVNTIHGKTRTHSYMVWCNMRRRCNDPLNKCYHRYGQRGIKVCKSWEDFSNFISDMGECPQGMSLDRINNNEGYSRSNCRWTNKKTQANNTSTNLFVCHDKQRKTLSQWSDDSGIDYHVLYWRYVIKQWPFEKAISKKIRRKISVKHSLTSLMQM